MAGDGGGFDVGDLVTLPPPPDRVWTNRLAATPLTETALEGMYVAWGPDMRIEMRSALYPPIGEKAEARAEAALQRHMTPRQWKSWQQHDWCWVDSELGRRYKLFKSWTYNIHEYKKCGFAWKPIASWCLGTRASVPLSDIWLTQLLYLKYSEAAFRKVANRQAS